MTPGCPLLPSEGNLTLLLNYSVSLSGQQKEEGPGRVLADRSSYVRKAHGRRTILVECRTFTRSARGLWRRMRARCCRRSWTWL